MGIEIAEAFEPARALIAAAGEPVATTLARGRAFEHTSSLQPALTAVALGATAALRELGVRPDVVLGHSLGELAAWSATGAVHAAAAVRLAAARGRAMQSQASRLPSGGMLALQECTLSDVSEALVAGRACGELSIAAQNTKREWVLSGDAPALRAAARRIARSCRSVRLPVSGPWHARSMAAAAPAFEIALQETLGCGAAGQNLVPMICNATADVAPPQRIPRLLTKQLAAPVRWVGSMRRLVRLGVTDVVTPGPGKALRHHLRRAHPEVRVHACTTPDDVRRIAAGFAS